MTSAEGSTRLQEVARYRTAHRLLRRGAIGSIVSGGLMLGIGLGSGDQFLTGVGAVLLCTGAWTFLVPRPIGIVVDGLALVTVAGYNLSSVVVTVLGQWVPGAALWGVVGALQFVLGVHAFARLLQFGGALKSPPDAAELGDLEAIAADVWNAPIEASGDIVAFVVNGRHPATWKACLGADTVVIASGGGAEIRVCDRDAFDIELADESTPGTPTVKIHAGAKAWRGTIDRAALERFYDWKQGTAPMEAVAA